MTPEKAARLRKARRAVVIDEVHQVFARQAWRYREDPHGWSPSQERTVAVIASRV